MIHRPASATRAILMIAYTNYETDPRVIRAAEAAVEAGFAVDFISLGREGRPSLEVINGVRVMRVRQNRYRGASRWGYVGAYLSFFARCLLLSSRLYATKRYKIVHVNNMPDVLVFSAIVPKLLGAKIVLDIHDPMPETLGAKFEGSSATALYRLLLWMEQLSVAFADRMITVNEPVKHGILAKHGYPLSRIEVIANFADDRLFGVVSYPPIDGFVRFVFHGSILERYGLRTLMLALAQIPDRSRIRVRIVGEGDYSDGLRKLIAAHRLEETVEFDNRLYPLREIPRVLSDCHVGLVPLDVTPISDFALPLKLIEYTCLGLPSITVSTTAITHYLRPDECMMYTPGDVTGLSRLIEGTVKDPDRLAGYRAKLGQARERMSWSRERFKYMALLDGLVTEKGDASSKRSGCA